MLAITSSHDQFSDFFHQQHLELNASPIFPNWSICIENRLKGTIVIWSDDFLPVLLTLLCLSCLPFNGSNNGLVNFFPQSILHTIHGQLRGHNHEQNVAPFLNLLIRCCSLKNSIAKTRHNCKVSQAQLQVKDQFWRKNRLHPNSQNNLGSR